MFGVSVTVKEGLGRWFGGIGRALAGKSLEAKREIEAGERPVQEPKTDAEAALWQAMGWDEDEARSASGLAMDKAAEALR